jgi:serine/threonine protein kinase
MQSINGKYYKIGKKIGSGTFGIIFNITRTEDNRKFAVKKFNKDKDTEQYDLGTLREISMLKLLQNNQKEGIINLEDIILFDGDIYIVMEKYYMDLSIAIRMKILSFQVKENIVKQITKALAFLKHNGVIHRDIKPENILLDQKYNAILCDFSLAKTFCGVSSLGTHTGKIATVTYRAPEVMNNKHYDYGVDAWALGIIFYELFSLNSYSVKKDKEVIPFLEKAVIEFDSNDKIGNTIKGLLTHDINKRWTPLYVLKYLFNYHYEPPKIWTSEKSCRISTKLKDICNDFEIDKQVTRWAAQRYLNHTNCDLYSAVILACKFYETDLRDFSDFEEFGESEKLIFQKMNFNLYI